MSAELLREIRVFCKRTRIAPTRLARDAINDPALIRDLVNGRTLRPKTEDRLRQWMKERAK